MSSFELSCRARYLCAAEYGLLSTSLLGIAATASSFGELGVTTAGKSASNGVDGPPASLKSCFRDVSPAAMLVDLLPGVPLTRLARGDRGLEGMLR